MIKFIIKTLGLKGSWKWAKKQMIKGKVVRCKHWPGALKLKVDNKDNQLLQSCYWKENKQPPHGKLWETATHNLTFENFTDYKIVKGW